MDSKDRISPLFGHLSDEQAHVYDLVLTASGIDHRVSRMHDGWQISVATPYRREAIRSISLYLAENQVSSETDGNYPADWKDRSFSAFFAAGILLCIHGFIPENERQLFTRTFGADSELILSGQLFRCVTALLLHADWAHLISNSAGLLLFGSVSAAFYGWGVGWLLILTAGATANLVNAWYYQHGHLAIGASTALFAAVGLCAVMSFARQFNSRRRSWRAWIPIAGGISLLAFLGAAPHTDVLAHLFGFVSGLLFGGLYLYARRSRTAPAVQWQAAALLAACALVAGCWIHGLRAV